MRPWQLLVVAVASWRTTVLVLDDRIAAPVRSWVWARWPYGDDPADRDPAGHGEATVMWWGRRWVDRHHVGLARAARLWKNSWGDAIEHRDRTRPGSTKLGWLFTCPWCMGVWHAAAWVTAFHLRPGATMRCAEFAAVAGAVGAFYRWVNE